MNFEHKEYIEQFLGIHDEDAQRELEQVYAMAEAFDKFAQLLDDDMDKVQKMMDGDIDAGPLLGPDELELYMNIFREVKKGLMKGLEQ